MTTRPCQKAMMGVWPTNSFSRHDVERHVLFAFGAKS